MVKTVLFVGLALLPLAGAMIYAAKNPERVKAWRAKVEGWLTRKEPKQ